MATLHTEALVLRAVDFGESDRILHLLVPDAGRLTAIAKGARRSVKRFAGGLDLFQQLRVQLDRRRRAGMARLEHATLLRHWDALRRDPARFALGCFLLELLDRLAPEGGARADTRRLYGFAIEALALVAAAPIDPGLRVLLELRALAALGLRPELSACVRCGGAPGVGARVRFSVADGGPVCPRCARDGEGLLEVRLGTLRALEQGLRLELSSLRRLVLDAASLAEARLLIARFERFHVGVDLNSRRFLEQMLAAGPVGAAPGEKPIYSPPF